MSLLEFGLRAAAATQLLFLAVLFVYRCLTDPPLRYAAMLPVGLAAFMVTSAPVAASPLGGFAPLLTLICVANPFWFWMFTQALFDDGFRPRAGHAVALVAMLAIGMAHQTGAHPPAAWLDVLFKGMTLGFVVLPVAQVWLDHGQDLDEPRRRGRLAFVAAIGVYVVVSIALQIGYAGRLPQALVQANLALWFIVAFAGSVWLATRPAGAEPAGSAPPPSRSRTPVDAALVARIRDAMEGARLYRKESLTVAALAQALGSQEYLMRRAINGGLGYRNFNDFLHRYRLDEASVRLRSQPHLPILTIALDVGYGSIGPFNRAFRSRFGCTPTEYRGAPQAATPISAPIASG